ncbi:unnamed protein product [marine sediment metagenome]|uniref:Uncharacterized protein n=1 Tax=marine sediment metagenome TaxID=412755 RepID=X1PK72_9ZZZZ
MTILNAQNVFNIEKKDIRLPFSNDQMIFQRPEHLIFEIHPENQNKAGTMESDEEIIEEF